MKNWEKSRKRRRSRGVSLTELREAREALRKKLEDEARHRWESTWRFR